MSTRLLDVLGLYRLHTALVTAAVPGIAAYIAGGGPVLVFSVVMGSILHHAWGFSFNEIMDLDIDRRNEELSHKPLVSGRIRKRGAWLLSVSALFLSFASFCIGALLGGGSLPAMIVFLTAATISGAVYDAYGKRFPLSDIFVALWLFFLVLTAAGQVDGLGPFPLAVWAAAVLGFLHILFNNSVEGGLKDVANDRRTGARTLAVVSGVKVAGGRIQVPWPFRAWGLLLRISFLITASVLTLFIAEGADVGSWILVTVPLVGLFLFAHSMTFLAGRVKRDRRALIRSFAVHEVISFGCSILVVLPAAGPVAAVIAFSAPLLWVLLLNRMVFRTGLAPKV